MLRASEMQTAATYILCRRGTVEQWVVLCPILKSVHGSRGSTEEAAQETVVVVKIGDVGGSQDHTGGGLVGGAPQVETTGTS